MEINKEDKEKRRRQQKLQNETSESLFRFSISMLTLSLLNKSLYELQPGNCLSQEIASRWYYLALLSVLLILSSGYLRLRFNLGQMWVIEHVFDNLVFKNIKYFGYIVILVLLGENMLNVFKSDWPMLGYWGLVICWGGALTCFYILLRNTMFRNKKQIIQNIIDRH